jgi:hypothetical protein
MITIPKEVTGIVISPPNVNRLCFVATVTYYTGSVRHIMEGLDSSLEAALERAIDLVQVDLAWYEHGDPAADDEPPYGDYVDGKHFDELVPGFDDLKTPLSRLSQPDLKDAGDASWRKLVAKRHTDGGDPPTGGHPCSYQPDPPVTPDK